jgi:hypothetical protein
LFELPRHYAKPIIAKSTHPMKNYLSISFISFSLLAIIFAGCQKTETYDAIPEQDNAMAENESNHVIQAVNTTATGAGLMGSSEDVRDPQGFLPACATVTIDTIDALRTITIDFGTSPCLCSDWDNRYREGKIMATWTGAYRDSGTVITIVTQDYFQGVLPTQMNSFAYSKTVTNMGHNDNGNLHYAINVSEALITLWSGETITWTSQRDREWTAGEPTLLIFDDVYSITGSASGVDRNGDPFTVNITNPLIVKLSCPWITQGTLEITRGTNPTSTLDYGDGTCDDIASVTFNGNTITFHM